jgi:hypothetical protein
LRLDGRDRRRLALASALTVVALPAVWLVNRDDDVSGPNVAAVGLASDDAAGAAASTTSVDPMGEVDARYLDGTPQPPPPQHVPIAVGTTDEAAVATARAIYRRSVGRPDTCAFNGIEPGESITVVNVDNGRSVECSTALRPMDAPRGELVMHPDRFRHIADLTNTSILVEIRQ